MPVLQTADVGLTESTGDSGLKFEIWFRRRTSKNQTFILQATTTDAKHAWTNDIARILWTQATRNKGADGGAFRRALVSEINSPVCLSASRDAFEGDGVDGRGQQTVLGHPAERRGHQRPSRSLHDEEQRCRSDFTFTRIHQLAR